jgi:uncharacterized membrane protein YczE
MRFTLKKVLVYLLGLSLLGVTVTLMQKSNLGMSSWDAFYRNLYDGIPLSYRYLNPIVAAVIAPLAYLLQKKKLTLWVLFPVAISYYIGAVIDGLLLVVPDVAAGPWWLNALYLALAIAVCAVGLNIVVWCGFPLPALDELCYAFGILLHSTYGRGKLVGEFLALTPAVVTGLLYGFWNVHFNIGIATVVFALAVGPSIDLIRKPVHGVLEAIAR